uniref:SLIT-ROBO Rho GTPase-activating protein 2-like n=1 Tax=Sinocyclocheilus rhinocerous TaxID=307959 RepID=A0A673KRK7_9TELE
MTSPAKFRKDKEIISEYETQVKEIRAQLVEQLKCLDQQCELRVQLLQDLQDFFRKKAEIEMDYSRNLEKLAERFLAKTRYTKDPQFKKEQNVLSPVNCWNLLLAQVKRESRDHATLSDLYLNNIIPRFAQVSEDSGRLFKKSKEVGLQLHEDLMKVLNELYTVMKTYHMYNMDSINAESKLKEAEKQEEKQMSRSVRHEDRQTPRSPDSLTNIKIEEKHVRRSSVKKIEKMKEKRQAKYTENKLKANKARNEYLLALEATNNCVFKYYIHDLSDLIDCCDLGYHASLNRALRTYLSAEFNVETSKHGGLETIENAAENLEANADKQRLMETYNNVFCPPMRFDFQSHMGDMVGHLCAQQPVQGELIQRCQQLQSRLSTLTIENEEVKKTMEATLQTIQDMVTIEDFDVTDCFHHSNSMESVKSTVSESFMSKPSLAKRRANQQETEQFYFTKLKEFLEGRNLITKLQAKHDLIQKTLGESDQIIPLMVESCIRFISRHGLHHEGIFRVSGSQVEVNDIKNAFERGEDPLAGDQNDHDMDSIAGVLKLYFRGLENALFPKEVFHDLMSCVSMENLQDRAVHICKVLLSLPSNILVIMRYLFAFLNHLSQYSDDNMMDPYNLAICFGPTLMSVPEGHDQVSCQAHVNELIKTIIIHHETIFPGPRELEGPIYDRGGTHTYALAHTHGDATRNLLLALPREFINKIVSQMRKRPEAPSIRRTIRPVEGLGEGSSGATGGLKNSSMPASGLAKEGTDKRPVSAHSVLNSITRHSSLKTKVEGPQLRKSTPAGRSKSFSNHRPLDPEVITQDIEVTMNTALSELRELERQSNVKHAPDVVLDTLEQLKSGGASDPSSPLHSRLLREADSSQHPLQRSASSASDMPSTFRPGKTSGPKNNKPPATKPKPVVFPKSSSAGGSPAMGSPTTTILPTPPPPPPSTDKSCPV